MDNVLPRYQWTWIRETNNDYKEKQKNSKHSKQGLKDACCYPFLHTVHVSEKLFDQNKKLLVVLFEDYEQLMHNTGNESTRAIIENVDFWKDLRVLTDDIIRLLLDLIGEFQSDKIRLYQIYAQFPQLYV